MIRLLLLIALIWTGPLAAQTNEQPQGTITVEDDVVQDAAIAGRIRNILSELDGYQNVTVSVSSGIVTLRGTTVDAAAAERLLDLVGRVSGVVAIENEVTETTDVVARLNPAVERFQSRMKQAIALLPLASVALAAFALVAFLGFLLARSRYPWDKVAPNQFIADIYRQVVRILFLVAGVVIALDILGATALLGTILGAAGIVGLAIGFAVRDTVENFIASIMLSIRQPFRPNDTIEIDGDIGKVIRLTSRATILLSFDGNHIRIPNATVFKSRIVNYTVNPERRFDFQIGVASDANLEQVRALAEKTVASLPFVIGEPEPLVWIDHIGDGSVCLVVTGWIDQRDTSLARATGEALRLVKAAIEGSGVEVPDTTYRVKLLGDSGDAVADAHFSQTKAARSTSIPEAPIVSDVSDSPAAALERLVDAERNDPDAPDLLVPNAPKE